MMVLQRILALIMSNKVHMVSIRPHIFKQPLVNIHVDAIPCLGISSFASLSSRNLNTGDLLLHASLYMEQNLHTFPQLARLA